VPLTDYGTPSTNELTEAMRPFVKITTHHMANHGAVAHGEDLAGLRPAGTLEHGQDSYPSRASAPKPPRRRRDRETGPIHERLAI
jgi:hypothetical protein